MNTTGISYSPKSFVVRTLKPNEVADPKIGINEDSKKFTGDAFWMEYVSWQPMLFQGTLYTKQRASHVMNDLRRYGFSEAHVLELPEAICMRHDAMGASLSKDAIKYVATIKACYAAEKAFSKEYAKVCDISCKVADNLTLEIENSLRIACDQWLVAERESFYNQGP